jgi:hypothetical protein
MACGRDFGLTPLRSEAPVMLVGVVRTMDARSITVRTYGAAVARVPRSLVVDATPPLAVGLLSHIRIRPFSGKILGITRNSLATIRTASGLAVLPLAILPEETRENTYVYVQSSDGTIRPQSVETAWQMVIHHHAYVISTGP